MIGDSDDDVLLRFTDSHLDGRWRLALFVGVCLDDGLHAVAEQLADYVLEVAEDIRERRVEVAQKTDLWKGNIGAVGGAREVLDCAPAACYYVARDALEEDLAYEICFGEAGAG